MGNERQTDNPARRTTVVAGGSRLVRDALRLALRPFGLDVVAESDEAKDAPALVARTGAGVVVLAEDRPGSHPSDLESLARSVGDAAVVVLVVPEPDTLGIDAATVGWDAPLSELIDATNLAAGRGRPLLTKRQLELLQLVVGGLTTAEIATRVGITSKTVNNHLGAIYRRLGAQNLTQAVLRASQLGLVRLP